jgi:hypothetical protein
LGTNGTFINWTSLVVVGSILPKRGRVAKGGGWGEEGVDIGSGDDAALFIHRVPL